jgi:peptidoglycan hydrolase-like amidase
VTIPSVLAAILLSILVAASVHAGVAAADDEVYRFAGRGTDHGVGLSQFGAGGRAFEGQGYREILAHYYPGTKLERFMPDAQIRALIVYGLRPRAEDMVVAIVRRARWTIGDSEVGDMTFSPGARLVLVDAPAKGAWRFVVRDREGEVLARFGDDDADVRVRTLPGDADAFPAGVIEVPIRGDAPDRFRGAVRVARWRGKVRVVNHVPIESVVRSVTPREMGPGFPMAALRSQAVATRTVYLRGRARPNPWTDFGAYRSSDLYRGVEGEDPKVNKAVDSTVDEVLTFDGEVAQAFYHAIGGGATEASRNVFTGEQGRPGVRLPYLRGGPDVNADGVAYDARAGGWKTGWFTLGQLSRILAQDARTDVGRLLRWPIETKSTYLEKRAADADRPANRGVSGRLTWVNLDGTKGRKRVAGWLFKSVYNAHRLGGEPLGSTLFFRAPKPS